MGCASRVRPGSSHNASAEASLPIENSPPGIQTMPAGADENGRPDPGMVGRNPAGVGTGGPGSPHAIATMAARAAASEWRRNITAPLYTQLRGCIMPAVTHRIVKVAVCAALYGAVVSASAREAPRTQAAAQNKPNIVLIFPDNMGWGELNVYGGVRGPITPRLDKMAAEGIRLNNFNVEFSCTVSRAALLTGRYAIRTGATQGNGITLWEVTIAEALKTAGYATGLFGKWHIGGDSPAGKRDPSQQGFDEFYGIPRTSNEAQTTIANGSTQPGTSFLWEGRAGGETRNLEPFNLETRRLVDRESAKRGIAFMERNVKAKTPFFMFYPMTHTHFPTLA